MRGVNQRSLSLTDFSPGIYSQGNYATSMPPAPLGAAQETNTHRCIALPGGGLGPMPKLTDQYTIPWPGVGTTAHIVGLTDLLLNNNANTVPVTELNQVHVLLDVDTTPRRVYWSFYRTDTAAWTSIVPANAQWPPVVGVSAVGYFDKTNSAGDGPRGLPFTLAAAGPPTGLPGASTILVTSIPLTGGALGAFASYGTVWMLGLAGTNIAQGIALSGHWGAVYHQGRVIGFVRQQPGYIGNGVSFPTGYLLNYSQPFLWDAITWAADRTFYALSPPISFLTPGSWGSISIGELIVINSNNEGSLLISGDLTNPTITVLNGVQPTGNVRMAGVSTPIGLIYCSENDGAWAWVGNNISTKISKQLRDDFFKRTTNTGTPSYSWTGAAVSNDFGISLQAAYWNQMVLFPNNFCFSLETQGWWKIEDTAVKNIQIWSSEQIRYAYGAIDSIQSGTTNSLVRFDSQTPATSWSWQSHPIAVNESRMVQVTDIEITALGSGGSGQTITVTLTNEDGTTVTETFNLSSSSTIRQRLRKPTSMNGWDIIVRVQADGNGLAAPVLHKLTLVYDDGTPTAAA